MRNNNIPAALFLLLTAAIYPKQAHDCGLSDFFEVLIDQIYCSSELSGGIEIPELLNQANDTFAHILASCSPTEEAVEHILHNIAYTGTPEMLDTVSHTPNFKGYDNIGKNNATPLATATAKGNIDLVRALLKHGANAHRTFLTTNGTVRTLNEVAQIIPKAYDNGYALAVLATLRSTNARYPEYRGFGAFNECLKLIVQAQQAKE